jgi:hypothetical protein
MIHDMPVARVRVAYHDTLPMTVKECKACQRFTPHEIHIGLAAPSCVCTCCLERTVSFELERD